MVQSPYFYEARGVAFSDYEWLRENADENGWVDPYDRAIEYLIGFALALTGGVFIIQAMPDYGTGVLLMFGVWFIVVGHKLLVGKEEGEARDSQP